MRLEWAALWRGPPFADFEYESFARREMTDGLDVVPSAKDDNLRRLELALAVSGYGVYEGSTRLSRSVFGRHRGGADSLRSSGFGRLGATCDDR